MSTISSKSKIKFQFFLLFLPFRQQLVQMCKQSRIHFSFQPFFLFTDRRQHFHHQRSQCTIVFIFRRYPTQSFAVLRSKQYMIQCHIFFHSNKTQLFQRTITGTITLDGNTKILHLYWCRFVHFFFYGLFCIRKQSYHSLLLQCLFLHLHSL